MKKLNLSLLQYPSGVFLFSLLPIFFIVLFWLLKQMPDCMIKNLNVYNLPGEYIYSLLKLSIIKWQSNTDILNRVFYCFFLFSDYSLTYTGVFQSNFPMLLGHRYGKQIT